MFCAVTFASTAASRPPLHSLTHAHRSRHRETRALAPMSDSAETIPPRPDDATTPSLPQLHIGNKNLKVVIHLPKVNGEKVCFVFPPFPHSLSSLTSARPQAVVHLQDGILHVVRPSDHRPISLSVFCARHSLAHAQQNTLAQRPRYYLTVDLRAHLSAPLRLREEDTEARYRAPSLSVIVPIEGDPGMSSCAVFCVRVLFVLVSFCAMMWPSHRISSAAHRVMTTHDGLMSGRKTL